MHRLAVAVLASLLPAVPTVDSVIVVCPHSQDLCRWSSKELTVAWKNPTALPITDYRELDGGGFVVVTQGNPTGPTLMVTSPTGETVVALQAGLGDASEFVGVRPGGQVVLCTHYANARPACWVSVPRGRPLPANDVSPFPNEVTFPEGCSFPRFSDSGLRACIMDNLGTPALYWGPVDGPLTERALDLEIPIVDNLGFFGDRPIVLATKVLMDPLREDDRVIATDVGEFWVTGDRLLWSTTKLSDDRQLRSALWSMGRDGERHSIWTGTEFILVRGQTEDGDLWVVLLADERMKLGKLLKSGDLLIVGEARRRATPPN